LTDPYVYPGSEVLRNILGIQVQDVLDRFESLTTTLRMNQLNTGEVTIEGNFDLDHLRALHRHIFRDVYAWAGELRTIELTKGNSHFCRAEYIESSAEDLFSALHRKNLLRGRSRGDFLAGAAHTLVDLNALHPFREGNGRAQRALLSQLGRTARWPIDWTGLDREANIEASHSGHSGNELPMLELLAGLVTPAQSSLGIDDPFRAERDWHDVVRDPPGPGIDL
jgi:cell filamentation protein